MHQFSHSVISDSLWPHGLQHARPPCSSPTPGVYLNSCPSSRWCHPTLSSSVIPLSSRPQSFPASGSFQINQFFTWGGQSIGVSRYADDTTLMAESEEELKSLLMKVKEENEKTVLKLNIQKTKIIASSPITSWQIDGETVPDFIFLGSRITADSDCSHEIKRCLLLGEKVMTKLDSILKSRDITLSTKVHLIKATVYQWSCMDVRVGL